MVVSEWRLSAPSCRYAYVLRMAQVAPKETLPARSGNGEVGWYASFLICPGWDA